MNGDLFTVFVDTGKNPDGGKCLKASCPKFTVRSVLLLRNLGNIKVFAVNVTNALAPVAGFPALPLLSFTYVLLIPYQILPASKSIAICRTSSGVKAGLPLMLLLLVPGAPIKLVVT